MNNELFKPENNFSRLGKFFCKKNLLLFKQKEHLSNIKKLLASKRENNYNYIMNDILNYTSKLEELIFTVNHEDNKILDLLRTKDVSKKIKKLTYNSSTITYICYRDFDEFKNITSLSLCLLSNELEFEIDNWEKWQNLVEVNITIRKDVYYDIEYKFERWKEDYPNIIFFIKIFENQEIIIINC